MKRIKKPYGGGVLRFDSFLGSEAVITEKKGGFVHCSVRGEREFELGACVGEHSRIYKRITTHRRARVRV